MKIRRMTLWVCCSLVLGLHLLPSAPAQGWVVGWGGNISGEATGNPSYPFSNGIAVMTGSSTSTGAVRIAGQVLSNAAMISAGTHSLALRTDGTVVGWGWNSSGEVRGEKTPFPAWTNGVVRINGHVLSNVVSIAASRTFSLALKKDGSVATWGENYVPKDLTLLRIASDESHSWGLKQDGTVVGWWRENSPSYGLLTAKNVSNAVAIAVGSAPQGGTRGVALKNDGTVINWGGETIYKDATPPAGLSNVVAVAAGYNHTLALTRDGTVTGWGFNGVGQATGVPTTNSPYVSSGQVRIGSQFLSNVVSVAAGREYSLALKKDGTVVSWGGMQGSYRLPVVVPKGLSNVVSIAAGDHFCLAITTNAAVAEKFRH